MWKENKNETTLTFMVIMLFWQCLIKLDTMFHENEALKDNKVMLKRYKVLQLYEVYKITFFFRIILIYKRIL